MKSILFLVITLISTLSFSQDNDEFVKRLKAINNQTIIFYNVDGIDFSSQTFNNEFSEKGLKKYIESIPLKKVMLKQKTKH